MGYYLNACSQFNRTLGITTPEEIVNNSVGDKCTCLVALMTFKPGIYFIQIFLLERNSKWDQTSQ